MATSVAPELLGKVVERLRAIADENRVRILLRLRQGKCNVSTLTEELALPQASVSKHLAILRQAGLVQAARQANQAIYSVRDRSVFQLCDIVCGGVVRHLQEEQVAIDRVLKRPRPANAGRGAGKRKGKGGRR